MSVFMIGASPLLNLQDSIQWVFTGLALCGFTASLITVPLLPEMLDQIISKYPALKDSEELNDSASGYFNGCLGVGEAIGPVVASQLVATMGFRSGCDVLALVLFVYTLFYFLFNGRSEIFYSDEKEVVDNNISVDDEYLDATQAALTDKILAAKVPKSTQDIDNTGEVIHDQSDQNLHTSSLSTPRR